MFGSELGEVISVLNDMARRLDRIAALLESIERQFASMPVCECEGHVEAGEQWTCPVHGQMVRTPVWE